MNTLGSQKGVLSRGLDQEQALIQGFETEDVVVMLAGEKLVVGQSEKIKSIDVSYSVKGGGVCTLEWGTPTIAKIGAPCTVYIGTTPFWAGIVTTSDGTKWTAEPMQKILNEVYFYNPSYETNTFQGTVRELIILALSYLAAQTKYITIGEVAAPETAVEYDVNSKTILDIIEFAANQDQQNEFVYGVDSNYVAFFKSIAKSKAIKINETEYTGDVTATAETDNVITVLSVFKNKEVKVLNADTLELESVYPVNFIGKVGIGLDPVSGSNFEPVANYYRFGHKEDRFEIDAPDMSNTTALLEAYRALRNYQITQNYKVQKFDYKKNKLQVGSTLEVITRDAANVSIYVDLLESAIALPASFNGSLFEVNETNVNDAFTAELQNSAFVSKLEAWVQQVSLVNNIKEVSLGYLADFDGTIVLESGTIQRTFSVRANKLVQYLTLSGGDLEGFDKTSVKLTASGNVSLINIYLLADHGKTSYTGYLRTVRLQSSRQGDFFTLDIRSFNSRPVLTFQKLSNDIRQAAAFTAK